MAAGDYTYGRARALNYLFCVDLTVLFANCTAAFERGKRPPGAAHSRGNPWESRGVAAMRAR